MQRISHGNEDLFTVIIPSYNHEQYVMDCLHSLERQTYPRIEVIIIDDCSSDNTYVLEQQWAEEKRKDFSNVVVLRNDINLGVVKTVNRGLKLSQGNYLIRLASDDCLLDCAVEKIIKKYKDNSACGMLCFNGVMGEDYEWATDERISRLPVMYHSNNNQRKNIFTDLYREDFISAPGCVIQRETYLNLGLYDESSKIDDWEYYLRIAKNMPIIFCEEQIVFFRQVADSLSHSPSMRKRIMMNQGVLYVLEKYKGDVPPRIANKVMFEKVNLILREALTWEDWSFAESVADYMKSNKIKFSLRSYASYFLRRLKKYVEKAD